MRVPEVNAESAQHLLGQFPPPALISNDLTPSDQIELVLVVLSRLAASVSYGVRSWLDERTKDSVIDVWHLIRITMRADGRSIAVVIAEMHPSGAYEMWTDISDEVATDLSSLLSSSGSLAHRIIKKDVYLAFVDWRAGSTNPIKFFPPKLIDWLQSIATQWLVSSFDLKLTIWKIKAQLSFDELTYACARQIFKSDQITCAEFSWAGRSRDENATALLSGDLSMPTVAVLWDHHDSPFLIGDKSVSLFWKLLEAEFGADFRKVQRWLRTWPTAFPTHVKDVLYRGGERHSVSWKYFCDFLCFVVVHKLDGAAIWVVGPAWEVGLEYGMAIRRPKSVLGSEVSTWWEYWPAWFWTLVGDKAKATSEADQQYLLSDLRVVLRVLTDQGTTVLPTKNWERLVKYGVDWAAGKKANGSRVFTWKSPEMPDTLGECEPERLLFIVPLGTPMELFNEGRAMHHCSYVFTDRAAHRNKWVYSIREKNQGERVKRVATVQVNLVRDDKGTRLQVMQVSLSCNRHASPELGSLIRKAMERPATISDERLAAGIHEN